MFLLEPTLLIYGSMYVLASIKPLASPSEYRTAPPPDRIVSRDGANVATARDCSSMGLVGKAVVQAAQRAMWRRPGAQTSICHSTCPSDQGTRNNTIGVS